MCVLHNHNVIKIKSCKYLYLLGGQILAMGKETIVFLFSITHNHPTISIDFHSEPHTLPHTHPAAFCFSSWLLPLFTLHCLSLRLVQTKPTFHECISFFLKIFFLTFHKAISRSL